MQLRHVSKLKQVVQQLGTLVLVTSCYSAPSLYLAVCKGVSVMSRNAWQVWYGNPPGWDGNSLLSICFVACLNSVSLVWEGTQLVNA